MKKDGVGTAAIIVDQRPERVSPSLAKTGTVEKAGVP